MPSGKDRWEASAAYFECYALPRPGWAWEFCRRHPDYRAAFAAMGRVQRQKRIDDAAKWGLLLLENPDIHAKDALVFWRADAHPGMLRAVPRHERASAQAVDLWRSAERKAIALTQAGLVVLVERDGGVYRLLFENPETVGDGRLVFDLHLASPPESLHEIEAARSFLSSFLDKPKRRAPVDPQAVRLARYLQAIDGRQAGASYAEIGRVISPGDRALDGPGGDALAKGRGRHAVQRGFLLMNGGYRRLLLPPPIALFSDDGAV